MSREQHVALRLQAKLGKNVRCLNFVEISTKHFSHRATRDISALRSTTRIFKIAACVLGICQIDVRNHIDNTTVGLFGQAFVLAAITRLHVENRNMQALCTNSGQTAISVTQNQQRIRPRLRHEFVTGGNDIADGLAQVLPHSVQVDIRVIQTKVAKEDAVERVIIVLPSVRQQAVEMATAFLDDLRQTNDLGACAHDNQKPQTAVVIKCDIGIVLSHTARPPRNTCRGSLGRRTRWPT